MKRPIAKFLFCLLPLSILTGCASVGPPQPPSLELPKPPKDLSALRKGDKVYLSWTAPTRTTDQLAVRVPGPTLICRSQQAAMTECGTAVAEAAPQALSIDKKNAPGTKSATYVDTIPKLPVVQPEDEITYAIEAVNDTHHGAGLSNLVHIPLFPALPPPAGFHAEITAQGVQFSWTCPSPAPEQMANVENKLRVYRRLDGAPENVKVAQPGLMDCQNPALLDTAFEWEKTYEYYAAAVTIVSPPGKPVIEIEGDDTGAVQVIAHDVFPPAIPAGLQAVFSGNPQEPFVDLIWSPNSDADLAGYNVYRREEGGQLTKLNTELVKTPAFRDSAVQAGKSYLYSVTGLDLRNNESEKSSEARESLP